MRLIHTTTLQLTQDLFGNHVPEKYAILSHRWRDGEVSLAEFRLAPEAVRETKGFQKIAAAARIAKEKGFQRIWIDTVCIDKTSSAELSESINSMFRWYRDATICFAYLDDVDSLDHLGNSEWFTRGWTLQELLAPRNVLFLNASWEPLQTKWVLAKELSRITKISPNVLQGQMELKDICAATRMSWASQRTTTRQEDIAYSLLGIFDVNMPLLYGEGARSFYRLQEAILDQTGDISLLAWNPDHPDPTDNYDIRTYIPALAPAPRQFNACTDLVRRTETNGMSTCSVTKRMIQIAAPTWGQSECWVALPCGQQGGDDNDQIYIEAARNPDGTYSRRNTLTKTFAVNTVRSWFVGGVDSIVWGRGLSRRFWGFVCIFLAPVPLLIGFRTTELVILQDLHEYPPLSFGDKLFTSITSTKSYHQPLLIANPLFFHLITRSEGSLGVILPLFGAFINFLVAIQTGRIFSSKTSEPYNLRIWRVYTLACGVCFMWVASLKAVYPEGWGSKPGLFPWS